jgi:hypothetical protein
VYNEKYKTIINKSGLKRKMIKKTLERKYFFEKRTSDVSQFIYY